MKRVWLALGFACLACCLPLILPFLGVAGFAGLGGWAAGLNWAEIACVALVAGAIAGAAIFILRRRKTNGPACDVRE
jgi:hypothetical protein